MKIAIVQYNPLWEDKAGNMEKIRAMLGKCRTAAALYIFPEMTLTGFTMNSALVAENLQGPSASFFSSLAVELNAHVMAGIVEENEGKFYNALLHFGADGKIAAKYRKIHPFSYAQENLYYSGGLETVITEAGGMKIGLSVCYDLRFPELYRFYGKEKVDLIVNIANWPEKRIDHWRALAKARAIENLAWFAGANRVGRDPYASYTGCSTVISPAGEILTESAGNENIIFADIDKETAASARSRFGFLDDIRLI